MEKVVEERLGYKGVYLNVDFYFGFVYWKLGIFSDLFIFVFVIVCVVGWLVYWKE